MSNTLFLESFRFWLRFDNNFGPSYHFFMTEANKTDGVGLKNLDSTTNSLGQVTTQGNLDDNKSNLVFGQNQLDTSNNNQVASIQPEFKADQAHFTTKSFQLHQYLSNLLHQHPLSQNSVQFSGQNLANSKYLNIETTVNNRGNQPNMQTFHQNSKLSLQLNKPAINTKTKTRQINLVPTLLITALLLVVGTLGYIIYYLYNQNQSLQKQVYAQPSNLNQDVRLRKLVETYEQEIANLRQKLNNLEQCNNHQTINPT